MLMQLDSTPFEISTAAYTQLQRRARGRVARIPLLGGGVAIQNVGVDHDIITLAGTVYPQVSTAVGGEGGTRAIDDLRDKLHDNLPFLLQDADGFSLGYWVVLQLINNDSIYHGPSGVPRKQDFQLTLQYYGETAL